MPCVKLLYGENWAGLPSGTTQREQQVQRPLYRIYAKFCWVLKDCST